MDNSAGATNAAEGNSLLPAVQETTPPLPSQGERSRGLVRIEDRETAGRALADQAKGKLLSSKEAVPEVHHALLSLVKDTLSRNKDHRDNLSVTGEIEDSSFRRRSQYNDLKQAQLAAQGEPDVKAPVTELKCITAESILRDVFIPAQGDVSWELSPSAVPELTEDDEGTLRKAAERYSRGKLPQGGEGDVSEIMESILPIMRDHVKQKAEGMILEKTHNLARLLRDQLTAGEFNETLISLITDFVSAPLAILKGPVVETFLLPHWKEGKNGEATLETTETNLPVLKRVAPIDFFPSPSAESASGPGPVVERIWIPRESLSAMANHPAYSKEAIARVLNTPPSTDAVISSHVKTNLEGKETHPYDPLTSGVVECFEFHGLVPGQTLISYGLLKDPKNKKIDKALDYYCIVLISGDDVLSATIPPSNFTPMPYYSESWDRMTDNVWGRGVPTQLRSLQDICDGSLRSMVKNLGLSAGPQVVIPDIDRLTEDEDITEVVPNKIWQFTNERKSTADPLKFLTIPSNAQEYLAVYENFTQQASMVSGIPEISTETAGGAGRTSTGLSVIMAGSYKRMKDAIRRFHINILAPALSQLATWNMEFSPNPSIQGDVTVVPTGAVSRVMQDQLLQRRIEFLNITNNSTDAKLISPRKRASILRSIGSTLELGSDFQEITLSDAEIDAMVEADAKSASDSSAREAEKVKAEVDVKKAEAAAKLADIEIKKEKNAIDREALSTDADKHATTLMQKQDELLSKDLNESAKIAMGGKNDTRKDTTGSSKGGL